MGKYGSNRDDRQEQETLRQQQRERNNPALDDWDANRPPEPPVQSNPDAGRQPMTPEQEATLKDLLMAAGEPYQPVPDRDSAAARIRDLRARLSGR